MTQLMRPAADRGHTKIDWLDSRHSFSFGEYYDRNWMHFGPLRVINDDVIAPGAGFPTHGHQNMEILTYVIEGAVAHRDSTGTDGVIQAGEFQLMHAGSGIRHSEYNHCQTKPTRLLQIWILPAADGLAPGYQQKNDTNLAPADAWQAIATPDGAANTLRINQDAKVFYAHPTGQLGYQAAPGRLLWVQVAKGTLTVNGTPLKQGDGLGITAEEIKIDNPEGAEILLFDLPSEE